MIDNEHGNKTRVLIQWMSKDYLLSRRKEIKDIVVGPDEYCILMEEGKIVENATQDKVDVPRLKKRFWLWGKVPSDVHMAIIDTRKHDIDIPFEAYTNDHELVRGVVRLQVNIRGDDCVRALRLIKESGVDGYTNSAHGFREYTLDDVTALLKENIQYVIDTESISAFSSQEVHEKRTDICAATVAALSSKSPYWANFGMAVYYSSVEIDETAYDQIEKKRHEEEIASLEKDLEFAKASGDADQEIKLNELLNSKRTALETDNFLSKLNLSVTEKSKQMEAEHDLKVQELDLDTDMFVRQADAKHKLEMMEARQKQEMKNISDDNMLDDVEKRIKLEEANSRLKMMQNKIRDLERDEMVADEDLRFKLKERDILFGLDVEERKATFAVDLSQKEKDADYNREIGMMQAKAEIMQGMKQQDIDHDKFKVLTENDTERARIDASVKIAGFDRDASLAAANERSKNMEQMLALQKEAQEIAHRNSLDNSSMVIQAVAAANGGRAAPAAQPQVSVACPACGCKVEPGTKFCGNCGAKLEWGA